MQQKLIIQRLETKMLHKQYGLLSTIRNHFIVLCSGR